MLVKCHLREISELTRMSHSFSDRCSEHSVMLRGTSEITSLPQSLPLGLVAYSGPALLAGTFHLVRALEWLARSTHLLQMPWGSFTWSQLCCPLAFWCCHCESWGPQVINRREQTHGRVYMSRSTVINLRRDFCSASMCWFNKIKNPAA